MVYLYISFISEFATATPIATQGRVAHNEVQTSSNTDMEKAALAAAEG